MNKAKLVSVFLLALILVPVSSALTVDEELVENAVTNVESTYNVPVTKWDTEIITGWHDHGSGLHKHVSVEGYYVERSGGDTWVYTFKWSGRSYLDGGIYTISQSYTVEETDDPTLRLTTTIKNPAYAYIWNGSYWVYNTPEILQIDGRTWVIYPKP